MKISPKTQIQINQVLIITVFWIVCGIFFSLYKCINYDVDSSTFLFIVPFNYTLGKFILVNSVGPAFGGIVGGGFLTLYLNEKFKSRSYGFFILYNLMFFFVFIFTLNTVVSYFFLYHEKIVTSDNSFREALRLLVFDPYAIRNVFTWLIIAVFTLQSFKIYEKYGHGIMLSMFLGKFHRPHEVQRIFMFLDLSNSTSLAERLGHVRFFELLRDFYFDITDPILNSKGQIYQYVGDEVVISWALSGDPHCLDCFFRIAEAIDQRRHIYLEKYGVQPDFKGAIHKGAVVIGEMGVIKKEIVYSGDILNTTSRIVEQCKIYQQKLIASSDALELFESVKLKTYQLLPLGNMTLRGKSQSIELFGVERVTELSKSELINV